jgi:hypothetical protein
MDLNKVFGGYKVKRIRQFSPDGAIVDEKTAETGGNLGKLSVGPYSIAVPDSEIHLNGYLDKETEPAVAVVSSNWCEGMSCEFFFSGSLVVHEPDGSKSSYEFDYEKRIADCRVKESAIADFLINPEDLIKLPPAKRLPEYRVGLEPIPPGERAAELDRPQNYGRRTKLGGEPDWIQGGDTPKCESCKRLMTFVAQIDSVGHATYKKDDPLRASRPGSRGHGPVDVWRRRNDLRILLLWLRRDGQRCAGLLGGPFEMS